MASARSMLSLRREGDFMEERMESHGIDLDPIIRM